MGEKYLAKWNWMFFAQIHGLPGFPLKSFGLWRASNGLPFVRRPWNTIRLRYLYSKSISKHFRKIFHRFQKERKIWAKNISRNWNWMLFAQIHGLPGLPLKSFVSWRASNGLPFVRRQWKTIRLRYLYSKSISKHFRKIFNSFQKAWKIWVKNISQSEIKSFFSNPRSSGLPIEILYFMTGF